MTPAVTPQRRAANVAIGWLAAFKAIPWPHVIEAAPLIVRGARTLLSNTRAAEVPAAATPHQTPPAAAEDLDAMRARLEAAEQALNALRAQQAASSALIEALAEQDQRLVEAVEILRVRSRALLAVCGVLALTLLALLGWLWLGT